MITRLDSLFRAGLARLRNRRMARRPLYRLCGLDDPRHPVHATCNLRTIDARIVVSHANRFVFIRVPKCANTTLLSTLWIQEQGLDPELFAGLDRDERRRQMKKRDMSGLFDRLSALDAARAAEVLGAYRKCMFVRNPYTRIASAYLHKIDAAGARARDDRPAGASFAEFCDYLETGGLHADIHWLPQAWITPFAVDQLDFVGHFENLGSGLARMQELLYGQSQAPVNVTHHATGADARVRALYDEGTMARIAALYAEDFRAFGYDPERLPGG